MPQPSDHLAPGQFFGRMATQRQAAGMALSESVYAPSLVIPVHDHELASVCLVLEGRYDEAAGRQRRACAPGMIVFHPEGEHHADVHHGAPVRLLSIEVGPAKLATLQAGAPVPGESTHLADAESARTGARLAREFRSRDGASDLAIESLMLDLLVRSQRRAATGVTRLSTQQSGFDANRYVSANLGMGVLKQFNLTFDYARQRSLILADVPAIARRSRPRRRAVPCRN